METSVRERWERQFLLQVVAVDPGYTDTEATKGLDEGRAGVKKTPWQGADSVVWAAATADDLPSGSFVAERRVLSYEHRARTSWLCCTQQAPEAYQPPNAAGPSRGEAVRRFSSRAAEGDTSRPPGQGGGGEAPRGGPQLGRHYKGFHASCF